VQFLFNGGRASLPDWTGETPVLHFSQRRKTCRDPHEARQYPLAFRRAWCPTGNIANNGYQDSGENAKSSPAIARLKKKLLAHAHCRCRAHARFRAAPSAVLYSARYPNPSENVQNAASNCILAGNARISILPSGLSVRSQFQNGFHEKTSATNAAFIQ